MSGHIKSIIPQRSGVAPIDNNTVFYAPFDNHPHDTVKGIKPIGQTECLYFNGTTDYAIIEPNSVFKNMNRITISAWVNSSNIAKYQHILCMGTGNFSLNIYQSKLYVKININGSTRTHLSTSTLTTNNWYFIAVTYDGLNISTYIDGVLNGETPIISNEIILVADEASLIIGGERVPGTFGTPTNLMSGLISDVKLWGKALSNEEIKNEMNGITTKDRLLASWLLNENEGSIAYDYSSYGHDAVITGGAWKKCRAIYKLIKDGYPGGIIQTQEATENIIVSTDLTDTSKWTHRTCTVTKTTEVASPNGYEVYKATPSGGDAAISWNTSAPVLTPNTYTMSVWMRAPQNQQYVVGWSMGGTLSNVNSITVTDQWQKFALTDTFTAQPRTYLHLVGGYSTWATGESLYITETQVEAKPYATEFTPGKRSARQGYGGGVLIEEGTTNLIPSANIFFEGWNMYQNAIVTITQNQYVAEWDTNDATRIKTSGGTNVIKYYKSWGIYNDEQSYTTSVYVKNIGDTRMQVDSNAGGFGQVVEPGEAKRVNLGPYLAPASNTAAQSQIQFRAIVVEEGIDFIAWRPQFEKKSFPTSFIDGVRENALLQYSNPIEKATEFTVSFWVKMKNKSTTTGDAMLVIENGTNVDNLVIDWETNMSTLRAFTYGTNGVVNLATTNGIPPYQWNHIAVTGNQSHIKLYVNGEKQSEVRVGNPYKITGNLSIGNRKSILSYGNMMIDELRIDKIARTPEEIQAWHHQERNGGVK